MFQKTQMHGKVLQVVPVEGGMVYRCSVTSKPRPEDTSGAGPKVTFVLVNPTPTATITNLPDGTPLGVDSYIEAEGLASATAKIVMEDSAVGAVVLDAWTIINLGTCVDPNPIDDTPGSYQSLRAILVGNVGKNGAEMSYTPSGTAITRYSVCANSYAGPDVEPRADWFRVSSWKKQGEAAAQYLHKGSPVLVGGPLTVSAYIGKDGQAHASLELTAYDQKFLEKKQTVSSDAPVTDGTGKLVEPW